MTDIEQIERILTAIGKKSYIDEAWLETWVIFSGKGRLLADIPDDLNAIRELELLVIDNFGADAYGESFLSLASYRREWTVFEGVAQVITADAETRIKAMLATIKEAK